MDNLTNRLLRSCNETRNNCPELPVKATEGGNWDEQHVTMRDVSSNSFNTAVSQFRLPKSFPVQCTLQGAPPSSWRLNLMHWGWVTFRARGDTYCAGNNGTAGLLFSLEQIGRRTCSTLRRWKKWGLRSQSPPPPEHQGASHVSHFTPIRSWLN